jgi:hypothetical protein
MKPAGVLLRYVKEPPSIYLEVIVGDQTGTLPLSAEEAMTFGSVLWALGAIIEGQHQRQSEPQSVAAEGNILALTSPN